MGLRQGRKISRTRLHIRAIVRDGSPRVSRQPEPAQVRARKAAGSRRDCRRQQGRQADEGDLRVRLVADRRRGEEAKKAKKHGRKGGGRKVDAKSRLVSGGRPAVASILRFLLIPFDACGRSPHRGPESSSTADRSSSCRTAASPRSRSLRRLVVRSSNSSRFRLSRSSSFGFKAAGSLALTVSAKDLQRHRRQRLDDPQHGEDECSRERRDHQAVPRRWPGRVSACTA